MLSAHSWVCTQDSSRQGSGMGGTPGLDGVGPLSSGKGLGPNRQGPGLVFLIGRNQRERRGACPPPCRQGLEARGEDRTRPPAGPALPGLSGALHRRSRTRATPGRLGFVPNWEKRLAASSVLLRRGWLKNSRSGCWASPRPLALMRGSRGRCPARSGLRGPRRASCPGWGEGRCEVWVGSGPQKQTPANPLLDPARFNDCIWGGGGPR